MSKIMINYQRGSLPLAAHIGWLEHRHSENLSFESL